MQSAVGAHLVVLLPACIRLSLLTSCARRPHHHVPHVISLTTQGPLLLSQAPSSLISLGCRLPTSIFVNWAYTATIYEKGGVCMLTCSRVDCTFLRC